MVEVAWAGCPTRGATQRAASGADSARREGNKGSDGEGTEAGGAGIRPYPRTRPFPYCSYFHTPSPPLASLLPSSPQDTCLGTISPPLPLILPPATLAPDYHVSNSAAHACACHRSHRSLRSCTLPLRFLATSSSFLVRCVRGRERASLFFLFFSYLFLLDYFRAFVHLVRAFPTPCGRSGDMAAVLFPPPLQTKSIYPM